jgi:DNA-binding CsgD family transcriptional regulator
MTTSPLATELAHADIQRLCMTHVRSELLHQSLLDSLQRAVPFDSGCLVVLDPLTGWPVALETIDPDAADRAAWYFRHLVPTSHGPALDALATSRHRVARMTHRPDEYLIRSPRRRAAASQGPGSELRAAFAQRGVLWGGVILLRTPGATAFDDKDAAFMERIIPMVTQALQHAAMRNDTFTSRASSGASTDRLSARDTTRRSPGVLSIDRNGAVTLLSPSASYWLQQATHDGHTLGAGLPDAVWLAATALTQMRDGTSSAHPTLHVQSMAGTWLTIEAFRAPSSNDVMVLIGPSSPDEIVELRERLYGLSTRERQIADLVLRGLSTRQISDGLSISESTVQGHLTHIFGKVEVGSRRALIQRLLIDQLFTGTSSRHPVA